MSLTIAQLDAVDVLSSVVRLLRSTGLVVRTKDMPDGIVVIVLHAEPEPEPRAPEEGDA